MVVEAPPTLERLPDDFMQRPYEILERFRNAGRVHHVVFPHGADVWLVTRYDDVRRLLSDPRVSTLLRDPIHLPVSVTAPRD